MFKTEIAHVAIITWLAVGAVRGLLKILTSLRVSSRANVTESDSFPQIRKLPAWLPLRARKLHAGPQLAREGIELLAQGNQIQLAIMAAEFGFDLGVDAGLPVVVQEDFRATGTTHIIAISG